MVSETTQLEFNSLVQNLRLLLLNEVAHIDNYKLLQQIKTHLPTGKKTPLLSPYVAIDVEAQSTFVDFFSTQWLKSSHVSYDVKKAGLLVLSGLAFMDTWISEWPTTWICTKEFLFENCPSDDPKKLNLCELCLWVLSNVGGDVSWVRLELASSTDFRAILEFLLTYAFNNSSAKEEMALAISTVCQSIIRSEKTIDVADPKTAKYFASTALRILKGFDGNLIEYTIENCFDTLQLFVNCSATRTSNYEWFKNEFMSSNTIFLIQKFSTNPSLVVRKSVLRFVEQMSQYDHVSLSLLENGILPHFHELLAGSYLSLPERVIVLTVLSNFCTAGTIAVAKLCSHAYLIPDLIVWANSNHEKMAIVQECYFVICNAVVNAAPKELEKMWEDGVADTLVNAGDGCIDRPLPKDIFRAYVKLIDLF